MKTPTTLLALGVVAIASTQPHGGLVSARPMHADIDYQRYLLEKEDIVKELKAWMNKWKEAAQKNGWIPTPKVDNATDEDVEEDRKQRFFLAKQLVQRLKSQNPDAEFSTDSPFTLLTTEEFSSYIKNSYIAGGGGARLLREEVAAAPSPAPAPAFDMSNINFSDWFRNIDWSSLLRPTAAPSTAAPATPATTAPATATPAVPATTSPVTAAPSTSSPSTTRPAVNPNKPVAPIFSPTDTPASTAAATPKPTADAARDANSLDWSVGKCMPPIQNQGQCGSCWAFSSVAAVEAAQCIAQGAESYTKYSEQTLASCDNARNAGCDGGVPQYAMQFIQKNGLCTLADDPYTSSSGRLSACNAGCKKVSTGMKGAQALAQNEAALMQALNQHPVVVAVQAGNDAWKQYKSGVLSACPSASAQVDHAVVAVGYDATTIKIRNSWGPRWGEAGYVRVARSTSGLGTCKMFQQMVHPTF